MRSVRSFATGLTLLGVLGLTTVQAQKGAKTAPEREDARPRVVTVRLLLGVGDRSRQDWSGKVAIDKGEVVGVEGWRFRQDDEVTGSNAWEARTRATVKAAAARRRRPPRRRPPAQKAAGAAAAAAGPTVPNGVFVALKAPDDARLSVETRQGNFTVALADLADGSPRDYLDGKVEAQVVPTARDARTTAPTRKTSPPPRPTAGATSGSPTSSTRPAGRRRSRRSTERPKSFADYVPTGGGDQVRLLRFADGKAGRAARRHRRRASTSGGPPSPSTATARSSSSGPRTADGNWDLYQRTLRPRPSGRGRSRSG